MKKEIRDIKAGMYWSDDDTLVFKITKNDSGVLFEIGDIDADIFYAVRINEKGKANFEWGNITPPINERGNKDAAN